MATQPTLYPEWASNDEQQTVDLEGDEVLTVVDNKVEPTEEWKASGEEFQENLPRQYINYQFDLINDWVTYFDQGVVGDYKVLGTAETQTTVEVRFKGTWSDLGTDTIAGETIRLFKKIA
jgi:hypothetical protein